MVRKHNHLRATNSSINQDYNMIDELLNNAPALLLQPPEKGAGQGEGAAQQAQEPGA